MAKLIKLTHNVVSIVTCYRLDNKGIDSWWGRGFLHPSRPALGPTFSPVQWVPGFFPRSKAARHGIDHPAPCSSKFKERVELYLYLPSEPSWPVLGCTLPSHLLD